MAENIEKLELSIDEMIDIRKTALREAVNTTGNLPMSDEELIKRAMTFESFLRNGEHTKLDESR